MGTKRFIDWSFSALPADRAAGVRRPAQRTIRNGAGQQQGDAEHPLGAERDLVEAE